MRRPPSRYGEIVERTVPDPSGSFPPTREQVREGLHRADEVVQHPMNPTEHLLAMRVYEALRADGRVDLGQVEIVVQDSRVFVTGIVPGPGTVARIEDIIGHVRGVAQVVNDLIIHEPGAQTP